MQIFVCRAGRVTYKTTIGTISCVKYNLFYIGEPQFKKYAVSKFIRLLYGVRSKYLLLVFIRRKILPVGLFAYWTVKR